MVEGLTPDSKSRSPIIREPENVADIKKKMLEREEVDRARVVHEWRSHMGMGPDATPSQQQLADFAKSKLTRHQDRRAYTALTGDEKATQTTPQSEAVLQTMEKVRAQEEAFTLAVQKSTDPLVARALSGRVSQGSIKRD
ncbi:MAG: hypothetical protein ACKVOH_05665 [Chlamydiales bacterium]